MCSCVFSAYSFARDKHALWLPPPPPLSHSATSNFNPPPVPPSPSPSKTNSKNGTILSSSRATVYDAIVSVAQAREFFINIDFRERGGFTQRDRSIDTKIASAIRLHSREGNGPGTSGGKTRFVRTDGTGLTPGKRFAGENVPISLFLFLLFITICPSSLPTTQQRTS